MLTQRPANLCTGGVITVPEQILLADGVRCQHALRPWWIKPAFHHLVEFRWHGNRECQRNVIWNLADC